MYAVELFHTLRQKEIVGTLPQVIEDLVIDSRSVQPGSVFICIKGYTVDGHDYAQQAVDSGATVIVTVRKLQLVGDVCQVIVQSTNRTLGILAAKFYDYPSRDIMMVGVTGTNGKTSVAGIIHNILIGMARNAPWLER